MNNPVHPDKSCKSCETCFRGILLREMHPITLIPGDGIGPEVASNVVRIIEASGVDIQWETHYAGAQALEKFGNTLPQELLDSITRNKVAL